MIKIAGSIAGVIAFIISLAGAIQYFKAPRVKAIAEGPVSLAYKPAENVIEISFDLTLDNVGYGSEILTNPNARIVNAAVPSPANFIPFANTDLSFVEKTGDSESAPLTIPADHTTKVKCVLRHTPGGLSTNVIETAGKVHLFVNLFGKKKYLDMFGEAKHYSMEFCFESNGHRLQALGAHPDVFHSVNCSQQ